MKNALTLRLSQAHPFVFALFATLTAFCTYSCMYAFRKPFAVATFEGMEVAGVDYKIWLIFAQTIGYALSKFLGIKLVSESGRHQRAKWIAGMIGLAGLALLGFAIVPPPYNIVFLFFNGLPLGMIWGLVFSYLEGRKMTEVLGAGLSISFIFSSGFVKTVGKWVMMDGGVSPFWMPLVTGALFTLPLLIAVWLLDQLPPPTPADEAARTKRLPMTGAQRWSFFRRLAPGLVILIVSYIALTALRDLRDNFSAEIWEQLGYGGSSQIFTLTEIPVSIVVLFGIGALFMIKNNVKALMINHGVIGLGFALVGLSTWWFHQQWISPVLWMTLTGLGLYLGYVPFNSIFFDRMIAALRYVGNVGFLIYLADSFGYLGSILVMLYKDFGMSAQVNWLDFFTDACYLVSGLGMVCILFSAWYFYRKTA